MFIIIVIGCVPTLKPIYDRFVLKIPPNASSHRSGYSSNSFHRMEASQKSRSPFNYREAIRSARKDDSEGKSDEIGLRDIHVRHDFEVLSHEEDDGKSAVVGQNVV